MGKFNAKHIIASLSLLPDICKRYKTRPLKDVIRHYDVTGKACPLYHSLNHPDAWDALKNDVAVEIKGAALPQKGYVNISIDGNITEIRADNVNGNFEAKIIELAKNIGEVKIPLRYV